MSTLHLISGLPCAGKSTYAASLRADAKAVLFILDRWLVTAFGRYEIAAVGHEEHTRRVLACRELIWEPAAELLKRQVDVILDDGFFLREHRVRHIALARAFGANAKTHYLDTSLETIRERLEARNARLPAFNFHIDPALLVGFRGLFEVPSLDEGAELVVVRDLTLADRGISDDRRCP
jgi:predicted kinase